ncbi:COPI associated [Tuber magnatum]|uniref:COPI associated n=1 Tax=Tuber magnatum TaxID=42249 RepID=A0A317STG4_9PEZI|nr:COPI associated [Tuber magnatum]
MDSMSNIIRLVNLGVGVIMVLGGISQFFPMGLQSIIVGCYVIVFGLVISLLEFQIPPQTSRYASFLFSFLGRGVFYIFVGSILIHGGVLRIIAGSIIGLVGALYVGLEFVPSIEPPENMRSSEWDGEQV